MSDFVESTSLNDSCRRNSAFSTASLRHHIWRPCHLPIMASWGFLRPVGFKASAQHFLNYLIPNIALISEQQMALLGFYYHLMPRRKDVPLGIRTHVRQQSCTGTRDLLKDALPTELQRRGFSPTSIIMWRYYIKLGSNDQVSILELTQNFIFHHLQIQSNSWSKKWSKTGCDKQIL